MVITTGKGPVSAGRWWLAAMIAILVLAGILGIRQIMDLDIGFHLRGGQWMIENRSFHHFDVFTYTVNKHEYIAMYWLFQVFLYAAYAVTGYHGLTILNAAAIIAVLVLIIFRSRTLKVPAAMMVPILLAAVLCLEIRFGVRPEIFTWIFMALLLYVLDKHSSGGRSLLALVPVIMLLWVNAHGLFVIGWGILGAYFIGGWLQHKRIDRKAGIWFLAGLAAPLANPYFLKGVAFPFYLFTRLQASSVFKNGITELTWSWSGKALTFMPKLPLIIYYAFVILGGLLILITFRRRKIHEFLLFAMFVYLSITAVRNIPLFLIAMAPVSGAALNDLIMISRFKKARSFLNGNRIVPAAVMLIAIAFCLRIVTNNFYAERRGGNFGTGLDRSIQPVGAARFLVERGLDGRFVNDLNHGSWLIWAARRPVFIDGRLEVMREELFRQYQASYREHGVSGLIAGYEPKMFIFDYSYPESYQWDFQLLDLRWRIIYVDGISVVYAAPGYAAEIADAVFEPPPGLRSTADVIDDRQEWAILRRQSDSGIVRWFLDFFRPGQYHADWRRLALFSALHYRFDVARSIYLQILRDPMVRTDLGPVYYELGMVYYLTGNAEKAGYCMRWVLDHSPGHKKAREIIDLLGR